MIKFPEDIHLILESGDLLLVHLFFLNDFDCSFGSTNFHSTHPDFTEGARTEHLTQLVKISKFTIIFCDEVGPTNGDIGGFLHVADL
jgi:hypothetical protein